jgi:hypothetical protein
MGPDPGDDEERAEHGRYIRDATGAIVVRGRTEADARRIVAAINGTHGIPTVALEGWRVEDVSDPHTRPDLEIDLDSEPVASPHQVRPPDTAQVADRRKGERRVAPPVEPSALFIDRRVFERRRGQR